MPKLRIATRSSLLALRQSEIVKNYLIGCNPQLEVVLVPVTTLGDIDQKTPLSAFGGTGVFVKALEEKLLAGEADIAVHSLKDVPAIQHPDLLLAAFPEREDVRDTLVAVNGTGWKNLRKGAVVGTSSPARQEQLRLLRPDLVFKPIRGNVGTRVKKVMNGEFDATVLAVAGLKRLGHTLDKKCFFALDELIPSPGQGALAVQCRKSDRQTLHLLRQINRVDIELQVNAERKFMEIIGGGCRHPVAAHAQKVPDGWQFKAMAHKPEWEKLRYVDCFIPDALLQRQVELLATLMKKE